MAVIRAHSIWCLYALVHEQFLPFSTLFSSHYSDSKLIFVSFIHRTMFQSCTGFLGSIIVYILCCLYLYWWSWLIQICLLANDIDMAMSHMWMGFFSPGKVFSCHPSKFLFFWFSMPTSVVSELISVFILFKNVVSTWFGHTYCSLSNGFIFNFIFKPNEGLQWLLFRFPFWDVNMSTCSKIPSSESRPWPLHLVSACM